MTDRDELADRLDAIEDRVAAGDTFDRDPLTAEEKRELSEALADGDHGLDDVKEAMDERGCLT
jgi:hypothetical protein